MVRKSIACAALLVLVAAGAFAQQGAESFIADPIVPGNPAPDKVLRRVTLNLTLPSGNHGTITVPEGRMARIRREADGATVGLSPIVVNESAVRVHVLNIYTRPDGKEMVKELEVIPLESGAKTTLLEVPVTWAMDIAQRMHAQSTPAAEPIEFWLSLASVRASGASDPDRAWAAKADSTEADQTPLHTADPTDVKPQLGCNGNCCVRCDFWVCACSVCLSCGSCSCQGCCPAQC